MENGLITTLLAADTSRAFDSVEHVRLIDKLGWYGIDEHWFAGANLYYVGERYAQSSLEGSLIPDDIMRIHTLKSYFDANAHLGYRINDKWSVYAKAHNIANQDYESWLNYPVQGLQFLAGTTYKFDF